MFSKQKSKFKSPYTHYFMDKEAQVVLGKKQLAPHAIYHRQNRAPYSSVQVNYDTNQRTISVLTNILFSVQHVLSPHLRVLLHMGDTVRNGRIEGQIWNTAVLNAIHSSDPSDADSVLLTSGPRYPTASTVSLSLHNIALSHMKQLPTANPTWVSGHVLCRFVNEQLKLSQLELSVRVQPERVQGINSGVAVFKLFTKYFDRSRPNTKKGVLSASYVHRINSNWFLGGGVKFNVGDSYHSGYRLRTGERDINWGGVLSVPRLKLGVLYQHDPLDATVKLRARLRNADNVELTGQVEKNFSEYGLSPYVHAKYSSISGEVKVGLGVNFSGV